MGNKLALLAILAVVIVALVVGMNISSNATDIMKAKAAIEAAKAAQITGQGLADTSRMLSFILVVLTLAVVALAGTVIYLAFFRKAPTPPARWQPGPNAKWARQSKPAPQLDPMKALIELYIADQLQQRQPRTPQYIEPSVVEEEQEEILW